MSDSADTDDRRLPRPNAYGVVFGTCLVVGMGLAVGGGEPFDTYGIGVLVLAGVTAVVAMVRNRPDEERTAQDDDDGSDGQDQREKELTADAGASGMT